MNMTLNSLLEELAEQNGSDLHLVVGEPPVFRVRGALIRRSEGPVLGVSEMQALLFPGLTENQRTLLEQGEDVEKSFSMGKNRYRFQVFRERGNLAASLRVIPLRVPTLEELGLTKADHAVIYKLTELTRGLVIIAGPTGSGKSTTIASLIDTINEQRSERIITIEDPIEYQFENKQSIISQRNVGEDVRSFPYGLRSAMHEDPDVLFVGSMRDMETSMLALTTAETGHLVFSTLQVGTASDVIHRLIDAWPQYQQPIVRQMIATNLQAVVVQNLIPRLNRSGRVLAQEIMLASPRVRQMIASGHNDLTVAIEAGRDLGMRTMDDDLVRLVEQGIISPDAAWFRLKDKERISRMTTV